MPVLNCSCIFKIIWFHSKKNLHTAGSSFKWNMNNHMSAYNTILLKMYSWYFDFEPVTFSQRAMKELLGDELYHSLVKTDFT